MTGIFARKALLPKGWADDVRLEVGADGIATVDAGATASASDIEVGIVIPGLCNAHSHAFQRALAGRTEERSPAARDTFWTWRKRMYELAARVDGDALAGIAAQAYVEMLESGYTSVAEFHYLHHDVNGADDSTMHRALAAAAERSGIRMTYVPVLYERAGFEDAEPAGYQAQFALDLERFVLHFEAARDRLPERGGLGIGAHSLRAVSKTSLAEIAAIARREQVPLHLHIAEQQREVDQCMAAYGRRTVRWLLENHAVDAHWCLVHATHMDADETESLAASDAVVCLCPSTEANLGDGLFPLHRYLSHGGRIAIGSDSHVSINPFEELRWLEYGQRLASQSRNIASLQEAHVGRELFSRALAGGAQAVGQNLVGLQVGAAADLVVLYDDDPMLVGHDDDSLLDALVFSGYRLPIDGVMVNGEWCVVGGNHVKRDDSRAVFAAVLQRIGVSP